VLTKGWLWLWDKEFPIKYMTSHRYLFYVCICGLCEVLWADVIAKGWLWWDKAFPIKWMRSHNHMYLCSGLCEVLWTDVLAKGWLWWDKAFPISCMKSHNQMYSKSSSIYKILWRALLTKGWLWLWDKAFPIMCMMSHGHITFSGFSSDNVVCTINLLFVTVCGYFLLLNCLCLIVIADNFTTCLVLSLPFSSCFWVCSGLFSYLTLEFIFFFVSAYGILGWLSANHYVLLACTYNFGESPTSMHCLWLILIADNFTTCLVSSLPCFSGFWLYCGLLCYYVLSLPFSSCFWVCSGLFSYLNLEFILFFVSAYGILGWLFANHYVLLACTYNFGESPTSMHCLWLILIADNFTTCIVSSLPCFSGFWLYCGLLCYFGNSYHLLLADFLLWELEFICFSAFGFGLSFGLFASQTLKRLSCIIFLSFFSICGFVCVFGASCWLFAKHYVLWTCTHKLGVCGLTCLICFSCIHHGWPCPSVFGLWLTTICLVSCLSRFSCVWLCCGLFCLLLADFLCLLSILVFTLDFGLPCLLGSPWIPAIFDNVITCLVSCYPI